jgi:hypothetical protein
MKSVTEFPNHKLVQGLKTKTDMTAEGKTAEEIQQSLGTAFKLEGEKLKFFMNAIDVASENLDGLSRILVVTLSEGESAPGKSKQVEEHHYVPEFIIGVRPPSAPKTARGGEKGRKGGGRGGPKESPWGLSPEQKAAKKGGGAKPN